MIEARAETLEDPQVHEVYLEGEEHAYTGRITGALIAGDDGGDFQVYLTQDERVLVYHHSKARYWECEDPEADLRELLRPDAYLAAFAIAGGFKLVTLHIGFKQFEGLDLILL